MAIVEGARGLWWSGVGDTALAGVCSDWCSEKTQYMDNLRSVVNELAALEPVLLADDAPASLSDNPNRHIKTKVKVVNGQGYVLAYNASSSRQSATFTWNTAPGTVTVNGENRTLPPPGARHRHVRSVRRHTSYVIATRPRRRIDMGTVTRLEPRDGAVRLTAARGQRPGRIAVQLDSDEVTIRIRVVGARMPARIYLYIDGDLADMWVDVEASYELRAGRFAPGPHAITARAVDVLGRWGGASTVVETIEEAAV